MSKRSHPGEAFYGMGDKPVHLNLRGKRVSNWATDSYAFGKDTDPIYKSVPFYIGLKDKQAYGIFFDNTFKSSFDFIINCCNNKNYLENKLEKDKDIITFILGGPTKYYDYNNENIIKIFSKINKHLIEKNLQLIVIPSNRTPNEVITFAKEYFSKNRLILEIVDKKAYLSSLALSKYIVVTCDSSSMISEAALTGKPIYVAMMPTKKNDKRFKKFRSLFESLNIIKELGDELITWNYKSLDETNRIALEIKDKLK